MLLNILCTHNSSSTLASTPVIILSGRSVLLRLNTLSLENAVFDKFTLKDLAQPAMCPDPAMKQFQIDIL